MTKNFENLIHEAMIDYANAIVSSLRYIDSIEEVTFKKLSTSKLNPSAYPRASENEHISNRNEQTSATGLTAGCPLPHLSERVQGDLLPLRQPRFPR